MRSVAFLCLVGAARALRVGVLGAHGYLGREVVSQCLSRQWDVTAYVRRPNDPVLSPLRRGWLDPHPVAVRAARPMTSPHLRVRSADDPSGTEDVLVSVVSGRPFADESSTVDTFVSLCESLTGKSARVCLVSAHGVGDSVEDANAGIQIMRDWYLRSTYAAKEAQEKYLRTTFWGDTLVLRPRVLSFEPVPFNPVARPRAAVAREICRWIAHGSDTTRATL
jgi:nucleoside-diphosphate-sugar epimerase